MTVVHNSPHPPGSFRGRLFVAEARWMQLDPNLHPENRNYPFTENDRYLPYEEQRLVGLYSEETVLEVSFDVDNVDTRSLNSVLDYLSTNNCKKSVLLLYNKEGWTSEVLPSAQSAVARINELMLFRGIPLCSHTIMRHRDLSDLGDHHPGPILSAFKAWRENSSANLLDSRDALPDSLLAFTQSDDGSLRYRHIGPDAPIVGVFGEQWRRQAIGQPTSETLVADRLFHEVTVRGIRSAMDSGSVCYESVMASVARPGLLGREWIAYRRLHLPFADHVVGAIQLERSGELAAEFLRPK